MKSNRILLSAIRWWKSHKPVHWSDDEHHKNPTVNCRGQIEHELAEAVAEALREKREA